MTQLCAWRPKFDMEAEIRKILARDGEPNASAERCHEWSRTFIRKIIRGWKPGTAFGPWQARWVGRAFEREQRSAARWERRRNRA